MPQTEAEAIAIQVKVFTSVGNHNLIDRAAAATWRFLFPIYVNWLKYRNGLYRNFVGHYFKKFGNVVLNLYHDKIMIN